MESLLLTNGTIVTGDGTTVIENGELLIEKGRVTGVLTGDSGKSARERVAQTIDVGGKVIMPGVINNHIHGVVAGPLFASGAPGLLRKEVLERLDKHLLGGTTTLLNVDGFATMEEVEDMNRSHPINIKTGTIHTPLNIKAAVQGDGSGLAPVHKSLTVEKMLEAGAVAIAEVGAGATLGGGVQDYLYIPAALKKETGQELHPLICRELKYAVLGRHIQVEAYDELQVREILEKENLLEMITPARVRELVHGTVLPPFQTATEGIIEAGEMAKRYGVPVMTHNAAASKGAVLDVAKMGLGPNLIAAHSNHNSFEPEEMVEDARELKELGATIDLAVMDAFRNHRLVDSPKMLYHMLRAGYGDIISTDWAGGYHDPILCAPEGALAEEIVDLPHAVAMVTGNVAKIFPGLAPQRGFLEKGNIADVVITDRSKLSEVDTVIMGGKIVVEGGALVRN